MKKRIFLLSILLLSHLALFGQQPDPLRAADPIAQYQWVDSVYKSLTLNEKIGQLFFPMLYPKQGEAHFKEQLKAFEAQQWGGVIFSTGTPERQSNWVNALQQKAKVPLLVSLDAEWGAAMRLDAVLPYPWNMTLGALKDNTILEEIGYRIGRQLKQLGVHMNYAPVLDINTNPLNPIIGNRSFGEDPQRVTAKGIAMMKGMHKAGILTSGKHFPGHGDTAQDSHKTLPTVTFDRDRLEAKELYPYRELIAAGISSIMVAHLNVPSLDPSGKPMSISKAAVHDLLKTQMGFNGLVVTDAMNMKGVAEYKGIKNADLEAFLAGNDLLLISVDIAKSLKVFARAYKRGIITEARLAHSVKKILKAKYKVGLQQYSPIALEKDLGALSTARDTMLVAQAMEKAITVLNNPRQLLPLQSDKKYGLLPLGLAASEPFLAQLQRYGAVKAISGNDIATVQSQLEDVDGVIISYHTSAASPYKKAVLSKNDIALIQAIAQKHPVYLNFFTKPYILNALEAQTKDMAVMVSYQNTAIAQQISADIMWGATAAEGSLPVTASKEYPVGTGISLAAQQRLGYSTPALQGFDTKKFKKIEAFAKVVLDSAMTPGLQMLVARKGKIVFHKSFGHHTYAKKQKVRNTDIYDLASLTKILGTMPMVLKAYDDRKFNLNSAVAALIPDWKNTNKEGLSAREVLSHYARLIPFIPFYKNTLNREGKPRRRYYRTAPSKRFGVRVTDQLYLRSSYPKKMYEEIKKSSLRDTLEYKYSDVTFYTMKYFLEREYDAPLDVLVHNNFYAPLGLKNTLYNAADRIPLNRIIPSEDDNFFRYQKLQGYVHDEGAAMLGGVGGHAGLFSNAYEVAVLMQLFLQKGVYNGKRYFDAATFDAFNVCYYCDQDNRRGIGFDKPQISGRGSTCGCVSKDSFGHFGFTGTYTWADPEKEIVFVFLSNRTYPTRDNNLLGEHDVRTRMQGLIYEALMD